MPGETFTRDGVIYEDLGDGQVRVVGYADEPPANPTFQYEGPQAAANVAGQVIDNTVASGTAPTTIQTNQAPSGFMWVDPSNPQAGVRPIPGYTPEGKSVDPMKLAQFRALEEQIARVEDLYRSGPGSTKGVSGLADYLPTDSNAAFDSAAAGLGEVGLAAFRVPGIGSQSDTELAQFVAANTPRASDRDAAIREKLGNLRRRLEATKSELGLTGQSDERPNALTMPRAVRSQPQGGAGYGATTGTDQYPPEMVAAHEQLVSRLLQQGGGRLDPQAYAQARSQLNQEFGFSGDDQADIAWANRINEYLEQGGASVPAGITPPERQLSPAEQLDNNFISSPIGAAAVGFLDTAGMGGVSALAPGQMDVVREMNPIAATVGQMAGGITGANAIGRLGGASIGRFAPQLLQGGARGQFGRNLATDATYGATYGGVTEGDPLTGAALGGVGSAGGQALGRVAGAAVGGVNLSPAAQALRDRGVRLTGGRMLGDMASAVEDKAMSIPVVGDMIRRRSGEAFGDFNRAAFEEAGQPIGYKPSMIGEVGIEQFQNAVSDAYDNATAGVNAPLDGQFVTDMAGAIQRAQNLPPDLRRGLGEILDARVNPINDAGALTGKAYQQAMRALKASRSKPPAKFEGFEQEYRDVVSGVMDALTAQAQRGGGQPAIEGLAAANAANRNLKILEDASLDRAKIGTQTGEAEVFLPSQLIAAARKSEKRYGPSSLKQLGKDGQAVLPSTVPNSGTADRAIQFALGAGALGGGAASDAALGTNIVNPYTLGAAGLLAAGGTRAGQNLTGAILNARPASARALGQAIRKRKGLFGSAAVPLLVAN